MNKNFIEKADPREPSFIRWINFLMDKKVFDRTIDYTDKKEVFLLLRDQVEYWKVVCPEFENDKEIALVAVENINNLSNGLPVKWFSDIDVLKKIVRLHDPEILSKYKKYIKDESIWKDNEEIALEAIKMDKKNLIWFSERIQEKFKTERKFRGFDNKMIDKMRQYKIDSQKESLKKLTSSKPSTSVNKNPMKDESLPSFSIRPKSQKKINLDYSFPALEKKTISRPDLINLQNYMEKKEFSEIKNQYKKNKEYLEKVGKLEKYK